MTNKEIDDKIRETKKFFEEIREYENVYDIREMEMEIIANCDEILERRNEV